MAGKRVRCVCGTVFDPGKTAKCPACGTAYEAAPTVASPTSVAQPAPPKVQPEPRDHTPQPIPSGPALNRKLIVGIAAGVAALIVLALIVRLILGGADDDSGRAIADASHASVHGGASDTSGRSSEPPAPGIAGFVGTWKLLTAKMEPSQVVPGIPSVSVVLPQATVAAFTGAGAAATMTIDRDGMYAIDFDLSGEGQYAASITPYERHSGNSAAQGVITVTPRGMGIPDRARLHLSRVDQDIPHIGARQGDTSLLLTSANSSAQAFFGRAGGGGQAHSDIVGSWISNQVYVDSYMPYRVTWEIKDSGDYRIRFTRRETGMLDAGDGKYAFKRSVAMGPPQEGRYRFDGTDQVTFTEPRGSATWVRAKDVRR